MDKIKVTVIGGGPGGYVAAIRAAQLGAEVTLVENTHLGGTCLNIGCIPTKALLSSAHAYHKAKSSSALGVEAEPVLHWDKVQENRCRVVSTLVGGVEGLLRANKVKLIRGTAEFTGRNSISVTDAEGRKSTVVSDRYIIATGSYAAKPPIPGIENDFCISSTEALALPEQPKSLVIIGGGVIGVELATAYSEFGTKVSLVEMADEILPEMDRDATTRLHEKLCAAGVSVYTNASVQKFEYAGKEPCCVVKSKDGTVTLKADKMVICTGRETRLEKLGLEKAGVKYTAFIEVSDTLRTSAENIYAIGDCNGLVMLASSASAQGAAAAENCMGGSMVYNPLTCPKTVFSSPELACVGYSEAELKEKKIEYETGFFPGVGNGRSVVEGETDGFVKLYCGKSYHEILGAVIFGSQANELINQLALAIALEATTEEFSSMTFGHPTLSESIHEAALASENIAIHMPNRKR